MSTFALISGFLWKNPEQRTARSGKLFVTATLRVGGDGGGEFWQLTAFSQSAQAELLRLSAGDALSAQGKLEVKIYTANDGTAKISRSIVAEIVLALRAPPKERKPKAEKPAQGLEPGNTPAGAPPFNDDIPFIMEWRG